MLHSLNARITKFLSNPKKLSLLNATVLCLAVFGNVAVQVFCVPSVWALVVIIICFVHTALSPLLLSSGKWSFGIGLLSGISFCLFLYCAIFLDYMNLWGLLLFPLGGLVVFIPHFFALQLLWPNLLRATSIAGKSAFAVSILVCGIAVFMIGQRFEQAIADIEQFEQSNYESLTQDFWTEKILGAKIIYHTRYCIYDGWRPPKHEPLLVLGRWLNPNQNLLDISLEKRLELYRQFFPEKPVKFDCSCAMSYSSWYHGDELWK